jgi:hypothetical protein
MHKKYNKFLIVSFIVVSILGVYSYFYNDLRSEAATLDENGDPITSSLDTTTTTSSPTTSSSNQVAEDTAFLMKLTSLTTIKVDASLFKNKGFGLLVDNNIKLDPVPYGRTNPFSPTTSSVTNTNNAVTLLLKTNPVSLVTSKSAILNGSLEGATSDNIYFEYGTTNTLGKVTPKVIPSLIGNFASNLLGLTSKTTYFYRAAASINGTITLGEIISFTTN